MLDSKRVLKCLPKKTLLELSQAFGSKGWIVLNKSEIVDRRKGDRSITLVDLLTKLKSPSLRTICQDLGLDTRGSKGDLIGWILGGGKPPPPLATLKPPIKESQVSANGNDIKKRLWSAADKLWADTRLKPSEFSTTVLGLIFLGLVMHFASVIKSFLRCDRICHSLGVYWLPKTMIDGRRCNGPIYDHRGFFYESRRF